MPIPLDFSATTLLMAPMQDVTTPAFVLLRKYYGGVSFYTMPMIFVNQIVTAPKTIRPIAEFVENHRPGGVQLVGSGRSVEDVKRAVEILNSYEFDVLDINCGCPAKHTCRSGGGASLMQPHRFKDLQNFLRTAISTSNNPVSVKIRLGWDSIEGLLELTEMVEKEGAAFVTVHGRLAKQGYSGIADLKSIRNIKMNLEIPVIGNGDICNFESYNIMKNYTGADAIMIGRASMGNPKLFAEISQKSKDIGKFPENKADSTEILKDFELQVKEKCVKINTYSEIIEYSNKVIEIIELLGNYWNNERYKFVELKRHLIWALKGTNNGRKLREKVSKIRELGDLLIFIHSSEFKKNFVDQMPL